jgi:choline dehydrogenase-like flavoprotein
MPVPHSFDTVVVGAGAAGCVMANRLSADPGRRVALIEAGPSDRAFPMNWKTTLPIGNVFLLPHARYNWQHVFEGGPGTGDRQIPCPRGRLVGGCTSVNGTVYIRGNRRDYDGWAARGNRGWAWTDVLPWFMRHENRAGPASPLHGKSGELDVQPLRSVNPLAHAFVEAAAAAGHARSDDFNGPEQDGFGLFDLNQRDGVRLSSSRAFLHPALARSNLVLYTDALVERVRLGGPRNAPRAEGVTIVQSGRRVDIAADEVILAAGTVNSPQLLLLSGLGPAADLRRLGIDVRADLPGVGENLQDHPTVSLAFSNPSAESYAVTWRSAHRNAWAPFLYALRRRGMLASNAAEAGGFWRSHPGLDRPDVQYTFMVGLKLSARTMPRSHGCMLHVATLRPATRGRLTLASADPAARPRMEARFLESHTDVESLIAGLREGRRILGMPAFARYTGTELSPGPATATDAELEAFIRRTSSTTYHPVGTCRMGPEGDSLAVVDHELRVHGVDRLRVADASVMPDIIGGNTSAPSMMIGERCAAFVLVQRKATRRDGAPVSNEESTA